MYYPCYSFWQVEYFNVGTPVSNQYYIGSAKGEIYGLDHSKERFGSPEVIMTLRPDTDIPGLLLTGEANITSVQLYIQTTNFVKLFTITILFRICIYR